MASNAMAKGTPGEYTVAGQGGEENANVYDLEYSHGGSTV